MKIRTQILLVVGIVALLPLLVVGFITYASSRAKLSLQANQSLDALAHLVADQVDTFMFRALEDLRIDALAPSLFIYLSADDSHRAPADAKLLGLLGNAAGLDPVNISSVALFDRTGVKLADTAPDTTLPDESAQPWITSPLSNGITTATPWFPAGRRPALVISAPVRLSTGQIVGVLRLRYELSALQQIVARFAAGSGAQVFAVVVDEQNRILADSHEPGLVGQRAPLGVFNENDRARLAQHEPIQAWAPWVDPLSAHPSHERVTVLALAHVPWAIALVQSEHDFSAAVTDLRDAMLQLGVIALLLCFVAAIAAAAQLTRPITDLATAAQRLTTGDHTIALPAGGSSEVVALTGVLNRMTGDLRHTLADLEQRLEEIRCREQQLRQLIDASPVALSLADTTSGRLLQLNKKFVDLFGYTPEELPTLDAWWPRAYPDPAERDRAMARWAELRALPPDTGLFVQREVAVTARDGSRKLIEFSSTRLGELVLVSFVDLTARKQAEDTLRVNEERFRLLIENSTELVAQIDARGTMIYVSPNHLAITGYANEELIGRSVFDLIHPEDLPRVLEAFRTSSDTATRQFRYRYKDGSWHWFESSGRRFLTSGGVEMAAVISRDITARLHAEETRQRLEQQLWQAQKLEALGTLAGGIAHDFNNILVGVLGNLQLAAMRLTDNHPSRKLLDDALAASLRARDLVARILTFSRRGDLKLAPTPLAPVVREALKLLRASLPTSIEIKSHLGADLPPVVCDGTQVHQIVMNLATNAGHAMHDHGGTLTVALELVHVTAEMQAKHPQLRSAHSVCLTVADTGTGMDAATLARIFEPFFTTKPVGEGTGLGLAVVHGIVQALDGAITVESTPGIGTTFRVFFVGRAQDTVAPAKMMKSPLRHGAGKNIAVVDDEPAVLSVCSRGLKLLDYTPTTFPNAAALLAAVRDHPARFDAVITDLTMPELGGLELARALRALRADLPVVLTSGNTRTLNWDEAKAAGVCGMLDKPFTLEALADVLHRALARRDGGSTPPISPASTPSA